MPPRAACLAACVDTKPCLSAQYPTVDGCLPASRAMASMDWPDSSLDLSQSASMTRTLVRVADGMVVRLAPPMIRDRHEAAGMMDAGSSQAMADGVQGGLALRRELAHALSSAHACPGDQAVQAREVELEGLELELGRGRLELAGADDE